MRLLLWLPVAALFALTAVATTVPPSASIVMTLPGKLSLHMLALPLGRLDGAVKGRATFDASGTRAVFVAIFPGATLSGDWRSLDPVQAFVLDAGHRTLTQLTIDGQARGASWEGEQTVVVWDGNRRNRFSVQPAASAPLPAFRIADASSRLGRIVATGGDGRFHVVKTEAGRYGVEQVGARALRFNGVARNGAYAIVGNFLVWVDATKGRGPDIARRGAVDVAPPSFAGSAYGAALEPIVPLGHAVYQGAYRNGSAYFAFTFGVRRVVAQTSDFVSYSFPHVPTDLSYTVGDGFGADPSGELYFARPESGEVKYWRDGHYIHQTLQFPSQAGSEAALEWSMQRVAPGDSLWPPLRPDEDALDAALLQWRLYPIGDTIGDRWLASYLGRIMIGDKSGRFRFANTPQFPLAVLGRTDDGRLWGASPQFRYFSQSVFADSSSTLWWTRDGIAWLGAGNLPGDVGAVGLDHRRVWVALTHPWLGRSAISVMPLGERSAALTGGTYDGEQLFFASLPTGFYVVWGATPGRRQNGDQGPLCAYRIDQETLFGDAGIGLNAFAQQIFAPSSDPSLPAPTFDAGEAPAFVQPSLAAIAAFPPAQHATLITNVEGVAVDPSRITLMSFDQERAFEIKYASRPYPIASVRVAISGDNAIVRRSMARGPLTVNGSIERWARSDGRWQRIASSRWTSQP
ncbi:MAG: hypothetical protein M3Z41_04185 [Candidatus Eremiobacteraeota bacterium]|nr:hypothetical protein [Candidatus Eremiobacteraeota bacterium]